MFGLFSPPVDKVPLCSFLERDSFTAGRLTAQLAVFLGVSSIKSSRSVGGETACAVLTAERLKNAVLQTGLRHVGIPSPLH